MLPVQITIRDMPSSEALEDHIRKKAMKLSHYCRRINSCRVVIHVPQKHKQQGKLFSVCIDLTVPGKELCVNKKLDEDVYVAIRDAFHAVQRQLESYHDKLRGEVKLHDIPVHGTIKRLIPGEDYGFITGSDGLEYYFNSTNVCNPSFSQLQLGDIVEYIGMQATEGMQAHRVTRIKNHHT